jgi:hypothetical protein
VHGHAEAVRAILHGTMALYLARYLNVPPARIPGDGDDRLTDLPPMPRRSAPLCSTPLTGSGRSTSWRALWHAISRSTVPIRVSIR